MYIINVEKNNREKFIKIFKSKGFEIEENFSEKDIISNVVPITINFENKKIGKIGNITCACIALKNGMIIQEEDFLANYLI